ncbi:E3 ubiquitin-protein ligase CHFR [Strigomonas culicis]|nr:E3 ubiquitin-protein ligase CHFR [Strigomonas culicis]|eukprot:EPY21792.1 E3 ubiquitin-protein ligase CHFR [Strigomonas culicis]
MHVFCASCISQWIAQQPTCAECRQPIQEVRPTHKIQSCVERLVASDPARYQLSAAEQQERDALDTIPPAGKVIGSAKRSRAVHSDGDEEEEEEAEDSDRSDGGGSDAEGRPLRRVHYAPPVLGQGQQALQCPQCETPSAFDAFRCPPHGPHLRCGACHRLYPERPLCGRPQRCQLCCAPYCNQYTVGEPQPCVAEVLRPLPDHPQTLIPAQTFRGNTTELAILTTYLAAHDLTAPAVWEVCLQRLRAGDWVPDLTATQGALTADSVLCARCAPTVFAALLFHYRRAIPAEELPESVTRRPHCWYGVNCRTQFSKQQHAQNYNHVCYQEKRKE